MVDLSRTIAAKSDQLNADDLMGGPITVTIQSVKEGSADQPVAIFYDGCRGKPFYPCKSMRRVLVNIWGKQGADYVGKSMTLYRDPSVKFGGIVVGGIRISHMSGLEKDTPMALQVTKGSKKLFTVRPLRVQAKAQTSTLNDAPTEDKAAAWAESQIQRIAAVQTVETLEEATAEPRFTTGLQRLDANRPELAARVKTAISERIEQIQEAESQAAPAAVEEWV